MSESRLFFKDANPQGPWFDKRINRAVYVGLGKRVFAEITEPKKGPLKIELDSQKGFILTVNKKTRKVPVPKGWNVASIKMVRL